MSLTLTVSPTLTFQVTISASVRPSPRSGRLNCFTRAMELRPAFQYASERSTASRTRSRSGRNSSSSRLGGYGSVVAADPQHRRLEGVEAALGDPRPRSRRPCRGTSAPRARRRAGRSCSTERRRVSRSSGDSERRSMTSSERPSSAAAVGRVQAGLDHRPVGREGHVAALRAARAASYSAAGGTGGLVDLGLLVVAALGLEEDHRVVGLRWPAGSSSRRPRGWSRRRRAGRRCARSTPRGTRCGARPRRCRRRTGCG